MESYSSKNLGVESYRSKNLGVESYSSKNLALILLHLWDGMNQPFSRCRAHTVKNFYKKIIAESASGNSNITENLSVLSAIYTLGGW